MHNYNISLILLTWAFSLVKDEMVDGEPSVAGFALENQSEVNVGLDTHLFR